MASKSPMRPCPPRRKLTLAGGEGVEIGPAAAGMVPRATAKRLEARGLATIDGGRVFDAQLTLPFSLYQPAKPENRLLARDDWPSCS